jgi:hypothetical protein
LIKLRRVWRYQRGNQNSYIDEQTTQWPKEKVQKDKQWSTQHTHKTKDRVTRTPLKIWSELRCSERISSSCSTSGTRRVNLVNQSFIYVLDSNSFCHVYPPDIERYSWIVRPTANVCCYFHLFCRGIYKVLKKIMYVLWFQRLFPYQMMFVSFNSKATKTTSGTRSAGPSRVRFRF